MHEVMQVGIDEVFSERYAIYGASTVKSRAIPSIEDGLNPVTRRIMYVFHTEGYSLKFSKAAAYVGNVLGRHHPHSDLAVYSTMIGLAQDFNKLNPLIDKQGNVGSPHDPKSFAAQRYVELRMAMFTKDTLMREMNPAFIPMKDNYDASLKEPVVLPSVFPMILNIGNQGIASGFASEIPPHKVDDICDITIQYICNPEISTAELTKNFRPDFPLGGIILNEADLPTIYERGQGVVYLQANIEESTYGGKPCLVVTDLPYKVSTEGVLEQIKTLLKPHPTTKAPGILDDKLADLKDLSSKTQAVNIVLIPKKDVSLPVLKNILLEQTSLKTSVKYLPNVLFGSELIENAPLKTILEKWVSFRVATLARKYNHEIKVKSEQLLLKKALLKAQHHIDEVIEIVKKGKSEDDTVLKLRKLLDLTEFEARYIANIRLYQIAKAEVTKLKEEIKELANVIKGLVELVSSPSAILDVIKSDLEVLKKKYKSERRSSLTNSANSNFDVRSVIESQDLVIAISQDNYVYAKPVDSMREYAARGAKGSNFIDSKYKRIVRDMFTVNSHDDLFCFTDEGKVIELKGYQLDLWHKPISNAIPDLGSQNVVAVIKANLEMDADKHFVFITAGSLMKRVEVTTMVSQRKMQGGNIAIKIQEGDYLVGVALLSSDEDRVVITSNKGRMQNLVAEQIEVMLRPTSGRPRAKLQEDEVIQCITTIPAEDLETATILVATTKGIGKVVGLDGLPIRRGDGGRRALIKIVTLRDGDTLLCGKLVKAEDSVVATTSSNKSNKISSSLINKSGRTAKGVKLVTLEEGDTLADISVV